MDGAGVEEAVTGESGEVSTLQPLEPTSAPTLRGAEDGGTPPEILVHSLKDVTKALVSMGETVW